MNKDLLLALRSALTNTPSANFSAEDVNAAAVKGIMEECGLKEDSTAREIRAAQAQAFSLVEEAIDEILPKKLEQVMGEFAEVRSFARDAEIVFDIEKLGKNRAKLTIARGSRAGIYRCAKLDNKYFSPKTEVYTVSVFVTLEEIILGTASLAELFNNVLEGLEEIVYKEVFNELATGASAAGYGRIGEGSGQITTVKSALGAAIDRVMPFVKQYGVPTIFGSYQTVSALGNDAAAYHPEMMDSADKRTYGYIQLYKGSRVVELPNYIVEPNSEEWFYDPSFVFVIPSGAKPVKVGLKGDLAIVRNTQAVGSEKWEAHKIMGVGVAMANNYAVIKVNDLA